jgi:hypothetical protein
MESVARSRLALSCGSCGVSFTRDAWLALPLAETLSPGALTHLVVRWPAKQSIEVRRCSGCGGRIARKVADAASE